MKYLYYSVAYVLLLFSCSCGKKKYLEKEYSKPVGKITKQDLRSVWFLRYKSVLNTHHYKCKIIRYKSSDWFSFLKTDRSHLLLFDCEYPEVIDSIRLPASGTQGAFLMQHDSVLFFVNAQKHLGSLFVLSSDSLRRINQFVLPKLPGKNNYVNELSFPDWIDDFKPNIFFNGGRDDDRASHYLDRRGNFLMFVPGDSLAQLKGRYPADFFKKTQYLDNTVFAGDGRQYIYYTFEKYDSIYKMNMAGSIVAAAALEKNREFDGFDWKKEQDLSYVRKYTLMGEANVNMTWLPSNRLVLLKQLPKNDLRKSSFYKYMVLDSSLNVIYADTVRHPVLSSYLLAYKKGFLLMGDSLKTSYYYEPD